MNDAVVQLNMDLTAGRIPDIIVNIPRESLPMSSYISKGLFEDIYTLMDKDKTFDKNDYIRNVFKAHEENGGLYRVIASFGISTVIGKTSDVGPEKGWSIEELNELFASRPADISAFSVSDFSGFSRDRFLTSFIAVCRNEFIDAETKECSFDSAEFISLLEFSRKLHEDMQRETGRAEQTAYRNGDPLLMDPTLYSFRHIRQYEAYNFGEEIAFKGYPNSLGNSGSAFEAGYEISIAKNAANKDGAWEFLKFLLTEAQDDPELMIGFPVKLSALEILKEEAKQELDLRSESMDLDTSGGVVVSIGLESIYYSGLEIIGGNTDADNEKVMDLINSISVAACFDSHINRIISEEAAAFFEGQKSAAEVAGIIQNRVSIYVSENG